MCTAIQYNVHDDALHRRFQFLGLCPGVTESRAAEKETGTLCLAQLNICNCATVQCAVCSVQVCNCASVLVLLRIFINCRGKMRPPRRWNTWIRLVNVKDFAFKDLIPYQYIMLVNWSWWWKNHSSGQPGHCGEIETWKHVDLTREHCPPERGANIPTPVVDRIRPPIM